MRSKSTRRNPSSPPLLLTLCLALLTALPAAAAQSNAMAAAASDAVLFTPPADSAGARLSISGPDGLATSLTGDSGEVLRFDLYDEAGQLRPDGIYTWELALAPRLSAEQRARFDQLATLRGEGRPADAAALADLPRGQRLSGYFTLAGGQLIDSGLAEEQPADLEAQAGGDGPQLAERATVLTISDGVIINSLCVGASCSSSTSFSDTTIMMSEVNTRLKFDDTSSASYPNRDWTLEANSDTAGGPTYLAIRDCGTSSGGGCSGNAVFLVEGAAPNNALYVDSTGNIGVGTSTPTEQLHMISGDTPTVRLQQDTTGGFGAQSWDIGANEVTFFVRDVTNGSSYPFRIEPGAFSNAFYMDENGNIGLGDTTPDDRLDIQISSANGGLLIESVANGVLPQLTLTEPDGTWRFRVNNSGNFVFTDATSSTSPFQIIQGSDSGLVTLNGSTLAVDGNITATGSITPDYVFEPDYALPTITEQGDYMQANKHLPAVGPAIVRADGKHVLDLTDHTFGMLEELEKAHLYIGQLNGTVERLDRRNRQLEVELAELKALVAEIAARR